MIKNILVGIVLITLFSCNKNDQFSKTQAEATNPALKYSAETLKLETFGFPDEIQGCSCYFSKNKADFESEKYIYADDFGKAAYIKINGKMVKIPMEEKDFNPEGFEKSVSGEDYEIYLKGKQTESLDEVFQIEGELTVRDKTGKTFKTPIYGECGC